MTNQEIITAVEEWVENEKMYISVYEDIGYDFDGSYVVPTMSLITFIKKLLHE